METLWTQNRNTGSANTIILGRVAKQPIQLYQVQTSGCSYEAIKTITIGDKVNSEKWDAFASATPDGKYILFNRGISDHNKNVDLYWVDAKNMVKLRADLQGIQKPGRCFEVVL